MKKVRGRGRDENGEENQGEEKKQKQEDLRLVFLKLIGT